MSQIVHLYTKRIKLYHIFINRLVRYDKALDAFFNKNNPLADDVRVLDAGCGSGTVIKALRKVQLANNIKGVRYFGFDITPEMLKHFKDWLSSAASANIELAQADVLDLSTLPQDWQAMDLVVSSGMLEYLDAKDLSIALQNIAARVKPQGKIIIFITKETRLNDLLIKKWWLTRTVTKSDVDKCLKTAGFNKITYDKFPKPYRYLNTWGYVIEATK